jgi:ribA/ribD-fused uncharacterized protein
MFRRLVRGYDDHVWDTNRFGIVVTGSVAEFGQNQPLRRYLNATARRVLVEASPCDAIWGIGLARTDPDAKLVGVAGAKPPWIRPDGGPPNARR